ncbi:salicylate synthase [Lentzea flaviverrucosa]|uniref:Salicylate synthetase/mycobactin phenyloxazoline synthetase n=1 Tax=Lentzea flaviverrucosa TaxID=200379 RepID=A0A1H9BIW2_9PSEU|nr:salicylate synthase [Lentzea flaviverrucosa]RDI31763.1 salicylate synthetase [Lentzea flaviverrucosa]SEP88681.1 salicylate synthetase/mycobactin phenyloxazoline synthetase [Lentzea flaviverrucosa]
MAVHTDPSPRSSAEFAASLIRTGFFDTYFVYEHGTVWTVAWGVRVEIVVNATRVRVRRDSVEESWPTVGGPLRAAHEALERLALSDWTACGWIAFEAVHVLNGRPDLAGDSDVVHLVVPEVEVRIERGRASVVRGGDPRLHALLEHLRTAPPANMPASRRADVPVDVNADSGRYREAALEALEEIRSTELRKVTLSRSVPVGEPVDFVETYLAGRAATAPARSFLLSIGGLTATGFCPETLLEARPDGKVSTQPLTRTRALVGNELETERSRAEMSADAEAVYAHAIAVSSAFDEFNEVCEPGSVVVDELVAFRTRGSVQHLASRLCGRLAGGKTSWDALEALFPAVATSGAPKRAGCEFISRSEATPRGIYSGAVLLALDDGFLDAGLVSRAVYETRGRRWLRAGAGIVASSSPERKFEETREKLRDISSYLVTGPT